MLDILNLFSVIIIIVVIVFQAMQLYKVGEDVKVIQESSKGMDTINKNIQELKDKDKSLESSLKGVQQSALKTNKNNELSLIDLKEFKTLDPKLREFYLKYVPETITPTLMQQVNAYGLKSDIYKSYQANPKEFEKSLNANLKNAVKAYSSK
jgi:ubiquitin